MFIMSFFFFCLSVTKCCKFQHLFTGGLCSEKHLTFTEHQQYEPQYRKSLNPEYYFVFSVFLPSLWKRCTHCCHSGDTVHRGDGQDHRACRPERGEVHRPWRTPAGERPLSSSLFFPVNGRSKLMELILATKNKYQHPNRQHH